MTNKEAHERAAGMSLDPTFFSINNIDPCAEYLPPITEATVRGLMDDLTQARARIAALEGALKRIVDIAPKRRDGSNPVGWAQIAREALAGKE